VIAQPVRGYAAENVCTSPYKTLGRSTLELKPLQNRLSDLVVVCVQDTNGDGWLDEMEVATGLHDMGTLLPRKRIQVTHFALNQDRS